MSTKLNNGVSVLKHGVKLVGYRAIELANVGCDKIVEGISAGLLKANDGLCKVNDKLERNIDCAKHDKYVAYKNAENSISKMRHKDHQMDMYTAYTEES